MAAVDWLLRQYCGLLVRRSETRSNFRDFHCHSDYSFTVSHVNSCHIIGRQIGKKKIVCEQGEGSFLIVVHSSRGQYSIDSAGSLHANEVADIFRWYPLLGFFFCLTMSRWTGTILTTSKNMLFNIVLIAMLFVFVPISLQSQTYGIINFVFCGRH